MQLTKNRLERIDIYTPAAVESGYIGKAVKPERVGYVYASVQPLFDKLFDEKSGKAEGKSIKLIMRPDAGVKCGDLAAVYGSSPNWEITEIRRFSNHLSATAVLK